MNRGLLDVTQKDSVEGVVKAHNVISTWLSENH